MNSHADANTDKNTTTSETKVGTRPDTREVLRPYKNKRIGFEGVLIHVIQPNRKNAHTYGLVFASVYAPNEKIELDHAVIKVDKRSYSQTDIELFKRYYFTAEIAMYHKTAYILGIAAKQENFMLTHINMYKVQEVETSSVEQPTLYVMNRINNVMNCKTREVRHTEEELIKIVFDTPNDGSVEKFIDNYTLTYQNKKLNKHEVVETLYS